MKQLMRQLMRQLDRHATCTRHRDMVHRHATCEGIAGCKCQDISWTSQRLQDISWTRHKLDKSTIPTPVWKPTQKFVAHDKKWGINLKEEEDADQRGGFSE